MNPLNNRNKNIGLLAGSMSSNYYEGIVSGAHEAAVNLPVNLIVLSGGPIHSDNPLVQSRDELFSVVNSSNIDAIIIPVSSLTRYMNKEEIDHFLYRFRDIPIINIGTEYEGLINIMPDYRSGLEKLMKHLIVDHGYRRIVLQRGANNHASSNLRNDIYRSVLERYGIPYDEKLVISVGLERNSINEFVNILKSRNIEYDAIITINSNATRNLIDALSQAGICVPDDVGVAGMTILSDDLYSIPELTIINEDAEAVGYKALETAYQSLIQPIEDKDILIDMDLFIGESCGCCKQPGHQTVPNDVPPTDVTVEDLYRKAIDSNDLAAFQDSLYDLLLLKHTSSEFINTLNAATYKYKEYLFKHIRDMDKMECLMAANRFIQISSMIQSNALRFRRHQTMYYINFLRDIGNWMNAAYDLSIIENHVITSLGVDDCYINICEASDETNKKMRNIISIKDRVKVALPTKDLTFEAFSLLHPDTPTYEKRFTLIVFPLIFRTQYYGNLIVNYHSDVKGSTFEALETIISTTVMNELQIEDLLEARSRFNDMAFTSNDWLFETNANHVITFCSASVKNIIDFSASEIEYQILDDLIVSGHKECLNYMHTHKEFENIDCCFYHKDKSVVYCIMTATPTYKNNEFTGYRGVIKDVTKQHLQEQTIKTLTSYDRLTGLPNRIMFKNRLDEVLRDTIYAGKQGAVIFINIDHFKKVNDALGHSVGDQLLQQFSSMLNAVVQSSDNLSRISGDEFAIIVDDIESISSVKVMVNKIITNLSKPYILSQQQIYITACIGVALYPTDGTTTDALIQAATSAMHRAKASGHNQHMFYNKTIETLNAERLMTETLLYNAFKMNAFVIEYQPKVDVLTGLICGLEALIRIKKEDGSLIYPNAFIELAEELNLISQIDLAALSVVCIECSEQLGNNFNNLKISVNLSAAQLKTANLCDMYMTILDKHDISPSSIHVELTESALVENESVAYANLMDFTEKGFEIELDDFGTGYASLSYFGTYPFNTIKIDRSFITSAVDHPKKQAILSAIADMAKKLGLIVVAEGVETLPQFRMVKSLGIDRIQGYFFEKPKPLIELVERIKNKIPYDIPPME